MREVRARARLRALFDAFITFAPLNHRPARRARLSKYTFQALMPLRRHQRRRRRSSQSRTSDTQQL